MIIVFDLETTGLTLHPNADIDRQPRIIEFGAALIDYRGKVIETESMLINPGVSIRPEITKITGLTDEDLADKPDFDWSMPRIRSMFSKADIMVAHNLPFDRSVLRYELARLNVLDFAWPRQGICTIDVYRESWGKSPKLSDLFAAVMDRPLDQKHRALDDVLALVDILKKDRICQSLK